MTARVTPATGRRDRGILLRPLGLAGWDDVEPVVLAALATEAPLLLIGPHGSAKTLVLNRLAEVLGLSHRHYNASILSFDDLVGFPVPRDGKVEYLQTPATIWEAESVLVDEISRCRPEVQNKLFPLIHERVVQGMPLPRLRFRWAAMNPPLSSEGESDGPSYAGSDPLDIALADRFAFVVKAPGLSELSAEEQKRALTPAPYHPELLRAKVLALIETTRKTLADLEPTEGPTATEYTLLVARQMEGAGHPFSTRRAVQLSRNLLAVRAATLALEGTASRESAASPEGSFLLALRCSIPDSAWGHAVPVEKLLGVHRSAWAAAGMKEDSPRRRLLSARSLFAKIGIGLEGSLPAPEAATAFVDAYSALPRSERLVTAAVVMPLLARRRDLPVAALEPVARDWASMASVETQGVCIGPSAAWKRTAVSTGIPRLDGRSKRGRALLSVATTLLFEDVPFEVTDLEATWEEVTAAVKVRPGRAA